MIDLDDDEPHHPSRSSANTKRARSDQEEQAWDIRHQCKYRRADIGPGRRRVLSSESDSDDEDVRGLMRVHLVSQRAQLAQQNMNSVGRGYSSNQSTNSPCSNVSLASDDLSTPMGSKTHWPCGECPKLCRTRSELRYVLGRRILLCVYQSFSTRHPSHLSHGSHTIVLPYRYSVRANES